MGEMSWRITNEQEFYRKAYKYVDHHVNSFMGKVKDRYADKRKQHELKLKYDAYVDMPMSDIKRKIHAGLVLVLNDVDNWKEFSGDPTASLDEIMLRALISNVYNCSYVCSLFVGGNFNLTEEFIEDYIYASSYLFNFNEWDDAHVKAVTSCAASGINSNKCKELIELYGKDRLKDKPIIIKIDLSEIALFDKSEEFLEKYQSFIYPDKNKKIIKEKEAE